MKQVSYFKYDLLMDFRSSSLTEVEVDIHLIVGTAKMSKTPKLIKFVAGHEETKKLIEKLLSQYGYQTIPVLGRIPAILAYVS